jgi:nucleoside phosphorylase
MELARPSVVAANLTNEKLVLGEQMQKLLEKLRWLNRDQVSDRAPIKGRRGSARVVVITVVDDELNQLRPVLSCTRNIPGTSYWIRDAQPKPNHDVVLKQLADRGNIASQEAANEVIEDFRPHFLLLVGIGGGIAGRDGTDVGDVIVVDYVDYYEFRKLEGGKSMPRKMPYDHPSKLLRADIARPIISDGDWANTISHARPQGGVCKGIIGNLITGEKLLADQTNQTQRELLDEYDKAIAVDMEACGLARAVFAARVSVHYNVQYAVVRGVSDLVDAADNDAMRKLWRPYAANAAATFAARMIDRLLALSPAGPQ